MNIKGLKERLSSSFNWRRFTPRQKVVIVLSLALVGALLWLKQDHQKPTPLPEINVVDGSKLLETKREILDPSQTTIRFANEEFGPYATETDTNTNVRTIFYPKKGQPASYADEEITLNLYMAGVWAGKDTFSPEDIASLLQNSVGKGTEVEYAFQVPDPIRIKPAFFITLSSLYPDRGYGQASLIKVASLDPESAGVYSVIFTKTIYGKNITRNDIRKWLLTSEAYWPMNISPSIEWLDHFNTVPDMPPLSFKCPESYTDQEAYVKDLIKFTDDFKSQNPGATTISDIENYRLPLLRRFGCTKTLENL